MQWQKVVQNQYEIGKFCDQSGDSLNGGYLSTIYTIKINLYFKREKAFRKR